MSRIRIEGPYRHGDKWRCRLVLAGRRMWCRPSAPSPEAARHLAEGAARAAAQHGGLTVDEAVDAYLDELKARGARAKTPIQQGCNLRRFFAGELQRALTRITPTVAAACYARIRSTPSARGQQLSVDSHRSYLAAARRMMAFCVEQGWIQSNPCAGIKPVGKRRAGKPQLSLDELRQLWSFCLEAAPQDPDAIMVLVAVATGLRAGEVVSRTVRSLDDGGRILCVGPTEHGFRTKNDQARTVKIPPTLQPHLLALARGKLPGALLWPARDGGPRSYKAVGFQVAKYCRLAGVPVVCAHSLRGSHATTALTAGATPDLVASVLGHHDAAITLRHYAQAGSKEAAQQAARLLLFERDRT